MAATNSKEELYLCAARLYSAESFLYKLVNELQRNKDMSKADIFGPLCHLHCNKTSAE
jgi:hypothetical protein